MLKKRFCFVALGFAVWMGMAPVMAEARPVRGAQTAEVSSSWQAALVVVARWFGVSGLFLDEQPKNGCIIDPNGVPLCTETPGTGGAGSSEPIVTPLPTP